ncbi:MAG: Uma2 family endonuclease [Candidatus Velthaea sp.]
MAIEYDLRAFTVDEYHRMAEVGILDSDERVELLDGRLVLMSPLGKKHWIAHAVIVPYLHERLAGHAVVGQGSFPLGRHNEPQPDIAVLAEPPAAYREREFQPADLRLVIELADSSLAKDTGVKMRLYGRFRIPDYIVVDLARNVLRHYTEPNDIGYASEETHSPGDTFRLAAFSEIVLAADVFLSPE